jgi:hypothetical protein
MKIMNSKIILALVALVAAAGVYVVTQNDQGNNSILGGSSSSISLKHVPADTLFFVGGTEPMSIRDYVQITQSSMQDMGAWFPVDDLMTEAKDNDAAKFLIAYFSDMISSANDVDQMLAQWGLAEESTSSMYTIGLLPVFKINLDDEQAYKAKIAQIKQTASAKSEVKTIDSTEYELFLLGDDGKAPLYLLHAVIDSHAIIGLHVPSMEQSYTKIMLGLEAPSASLDDTQALANYQSKYQFDSRVIGFFNHVELAKGLTSPTGNRFGEMVHFLSQQAETKDNNLASIQTPECQNEIGAIAANWPSTVFGYNEFDLKAKPLRLSSKMIVESQDAIIMGALQKLRGFVPQTLRDKFEDSVFSFALGTNVQELPVSVMSIFNRLQSATVTCAPLLEMQQQMSAGQQGIASIGMATGMVNGLQGLSMSIMDIGFELDEATETENITKLDALLTISATNPEMLFNNAASFLPPLQQAGYPADGELKDFALPMPVPFPLVTKMGRHGSHLGLTSGEKSEQMFADIGQEALEVNGFMSFTMDYSRYFALINKAMANMPMEAGQKDAFDQLENMDMKIRGVVDFTENGIEISGENVFH